MENDIYKIYHNSFGISFNWKRHISRRNFNKVQIVFRDMGFYLTAGEIKQFQTEIYNAKTTIPCECCTKEGDARDILLKTPSEKIDIAVNKKELIQIDDLIRGTLFYLNIDSYLSQLCEK